MGFSFILAFQQLDGKREDFRVRARVDGEPIASVSNEETTAVQAQPNVLADERATIRMREDGQYDAIIEDLSDLGPLRMPINVEEARVTGFAAVLHDVHPPRVFRTDGHVVRDDVEEQAHVVLAKRRGEAIEFLFRAQLRIDSKGIGNVISMRASRASLESRRGIEVGDSKVVEVRDEIFGIGESEIGVELNAVSGGRDSHEQLIHPNGQPRSKRAEQSEPSLEIDWGFCFPIANLRVHIFQDIEVNVLNSPVMDPKRSGIGNTHGGVERFQEVKVLRISAQLRGHRLEFLAKREFQSGAVEWDSRALRLVEERLHFLDVQIAGFDGPQNIGVQGKFRRHLETADRRHAERRDEAHQRSSIRVELAIDMLGFFQSGVKNLTDDLALLVAEEEFQRIGSAPISLIDVANQFGEIAALEGLRDCLLCGLICFLASKFANASGNVVIAEMHDAK